MSLIAKADVEAFVKDGNQEIWQKLASEGYKGNQYWLGNGTRDEPCQRVRLYQAKYARSSKTRKHDILEVDCLKPKKFQGICRRACKPKIN